MMALLSEGRQSTLGRFRYFWWLCQKMATTLFRSGKCGGRPATTGNQNPTYFGVATAPNGSGPGNARGGNECALGYGERLEAILGSNLSVGRHSSRSERLICDPCGV